MRAPARARWRPAAAVLLALAGAAQVVQAAGYAPRGAELAANRSLAMCSLCHAWPGLPAHLGGDIGPPLQGVGARLDAAALRQRLLAPQRFNPDSVMPAYGPTSGLQQLPPALRGKPLLSPAQIDDLVAWLVTLK